MCVKYVYDESTRATSIAREFHSSKVSKNDDEKRLNFKQEEVRKQKTFTIDSFFFLILENSSKLFRNGKTKQNKKCSFECNGNISVI